MQQVWILRKGELGEGGDIVIVTGAEGLAKAEFHREMTEMHFPVNDIELLDGGGLYVTAGCDYLELRPHIVRNEIEN